MAAFFNSHNGTVAQRERKVQCHSSVHSLSSPHLHRRTRHIKPVVQGQNLEDRDHRLCHVVEVATGICRLANLSMILGPAGIIAWIAGVEVARELLAVRHATIRGTIHL